MKAKRCAICGRYFHPYLRNTRRQVLCGRRECRQRKKQEMARAWWINNPDCLVERQKKKRAWAKGCGYWSNARKNNPEYTVRNREQTRERMRRMRAARTRYAAPLKTPVAYLKGLKCPKPGVSGEMFANQYSLGHISRREKPLRRRVFANQYSLAARLDGVCDFLIGREMFANQYYPDRPGREMVKLSNGGDSS
jgi:hypothetical protein